MGHESIHPIAYLFQLDQIDRPITVVDTWRMQIAGRGSGGGEFTGCQGGLVALIINTTAAYPLL